MKTVDIKTIDTHDPNKFEEMCKELINKGYRIHSSSCGFANDEKYDFCGCWQAIFVLEEKGVELNLSDLGPAHKVFLNE